MALTTEQRTKLLELRAQGLSREQAFAQVFRNAPITTTGRDSVGEDLMSAGRGLVSDFQQRGEDVVEGFRAGARGEQTVFETGAQLAGNVFGGTGDILFRGTQAAVTPFMSGQQEEAIATGAQKLFEPVGEAISETSPRTQRNIRGGLGFLEAIPGAKFLTQPISSLRRSAVRSIASATPGPSQITRNTPEAVIEKAEQSLRRQSVDPRLSPKAQEEAANAALNLKERYIGLTPDVKTRLQEMGPQKLQEYLDAAHLRNIDDTAPTPYELGSQQVDRAEDALRTALNDTGSQIGQTRQKLSTYRLQQPQVEKIDRIFNGEIQRLGLEVRNGQITTKPNAITSASDGDIRALNQLLGDLNKFKQNPTVKNAIDLRKNFDARIKFGKSARDVSNEVDPLARAVRSQIADATAKTVGKEQAALVKQYSDFMDAYGDLQSYTGRRAGGEYLLRLVLSGRGGEARQLIQTIKDYTGIDLMNDATAMKVATDIVGNDAQKNLFRQEVTRAGYDAQAVLSGSPTGILEVVGRRLADYAIDPEDVVKATADGKLTQDGN